MNVQKSEEYTIKMNKEELNKINKIIDIGFSIYAFNELDEQSSTQISINQDNINRLNKFVTWLKKAICPLNH